MLDELFFAKLPTIFLFITLYWLVHRLLRNVWPVRWLGIPLLVGLVVCVNAAVILSAWATGRSPLLFLHALFHVPVSIRRWYRYSTQEDLQVIVGAVVTWFLPIVVALAIRKWSRTHSSPNTPSSHVV
jgi:hypothetical protein